MSFWAATVITNLITSVPFVGQKLIIFIHGAFSVQGSTLNRFFVLHFLMALFVLVLIIYHISSLHSQGSTNPTSRLGAIEKTHFYFYFLYKDLFFFFLRMLCVILLYFFASE
jgi:ubiquinol-cytochrome c reductase cytochrome b subunit